jgi:hypothetical protein
LNSESEEVDLRVIDQWKDKLISIRKGYVNENIFNADETGLFFMCMTDKS